MGTSLNGLTPSETYTGLLKFGDNSAISASLKSISDGAGNDTMLELSTTALQIGGSTGMYWDNTNKRLGVNTSSPNAALTIKDQSSTDEFRFNAATNSGTLSYEGGSLTLVGRSVYNPSIYLGTSNGIIFSRYNSTEWARIEASSGNLGVGTNSPSARSHIKGSGSTSATNSLLVQNSSGNNAFQVRDDRVVIMEGLPISSSGLPSGAIWNDSGTLKIV